MTSFVVNWQGQVTTDFFVVISYLNVLPSSDPFLYLGLLWGGFVKHILKILFSSSASCHVCFFVVQGGGSNSIFVETFHKFIARIFN